MLVWLDGRNNTKARPQENFAREVMELFTIGVGQFVEADVYAGARVFTGWNLQRIGNADDPNNFYQFFYNAAQHDTNAKTFSFPIYPNGDRTIPARAASDGMQDGLDLIAALARHPETARRIARKLWSFFISEIQQPPRLVGRADRKRLPLRATPTWRRWFVRFFRRGSSTRRQTISRVTHGPSNLSCARSRKLARSAIR